MKFLSAAICIFLITAYSVSSQSYFTDTGYAEFTSSVPLHEFTGKSSHLTGMIDFDEELIDFYLDLETLKTGNSRRDRDMYNTLNVDDFPFAEFTGWIDTEIDHDSHDVQSVTVTGDFTIHGITREMTIEGTLQKLSDEIRIVAEWVHDMTDHDIEPPGILFYRVRDEMDVKIEVSLLRQDD